MYTVARCSHVIRPRSSTRWARYLHHYLIRHFSIAPLSVTPLYMTWSSRCRAEHRARADIFTQAGGGRSTRVHAGGRLLGPKYCPRSFALPRSRRQSTEYRARPDILPPAGDLHLDARRAVARCSIEALHLARFILPHRAPPSLPSRSPSPSHLFTYSQKPIYKIPTQNAKRLSAERGQKSCLEYMPSRTLDNARARAWSLVVRT